MELKEKRKIAKSLVTVIQIVNSKYPNTGNSWDNFKERQLLSDICLSFKYNGVIDDYNFIDETVTIGDTVFNYLKGNLK